MRRINLAVNSLIFLALAACSQEDGARTAEDSGVTQTRMDDIDNIEGTISDEMIDTTESSDQAPLSGANETATPGFVPRSDNPPAKDETANEKIAR